MITLCVYVFEENIDNIIKSFSEKVPCFVSVSQVEEGCFLVEVKCRVEDAASVERALSPYV